MPIYGIAGVNFAYKPLFTYCSRELSAYICGEEADFKLELTVQALEKERLAYPKVSPALIESLCLCRMLSEKLASYDCFLLHASAVAYQNRAYLFTAPSGTGKSTHTSLWVKNFPGAEIINDDKPYIRKIDGVWYACGSPWSGKERINSNRVEKVGGICIIERSAVNIITPLPIDKMFSALLRQIYIPDTAPLADTVVGLAEDFTENSARYLLCCNMESSAAELSKKTMSEKFD